MKAPEHILSEQVGDERIVLDLQREEYLSLNPTATVVWNVLQAGMSADQAVERVVEEFDCERAEASADVAQFIQEILQLGLFIEPR